MIQDVLKKIFGSRNERLIKQYSRQVRAINALEPEMQKLSDGALASKTTEFRNRIKERLERIPAGADDDPERARKLDQERVTARKDAVNELLPEAFAVVREAARRTLNMRHFDVQLVGGIALHNSRSAMPTGWGRSTTSWG
jgi:preprotein translocase subunit SecA